MSSNPLDPLNLTAQVQQNALLQQAFTDAQLKNVLSGYQTGTRSPEMQAVALQPDAPQMKFDTNATGIGTGIVQGLGNAANNLMALRNYRQKTEMLQGAVLEQRRQEQERAGLIQRNAEAQQLREAEEFENSAKQIGLQYGPKAEAMYRAAPSAQRGDFFKGIAGGFTEELTQPRIIGAKGQAETQADLADIQTRLGALKKFTDNGGDINSAEGQNLWQSVMKFKPVTSDDVAQSGLRTTGMQLDNEGAMLANVGKRLSNFKAAIDARYAEENALEDLRQKYIKGDIAEDELERIQRMPEVLGAAMEKIESGQGLTHAEMFELQVTTNVLAKNDPELGKVFEQLGIVKKDKKGHYTGIDEKAWSAFAGGSDMPSEWSIKPKAVEGNLVQAPSGRWYDRTTGQPVEMPKPAPAPAPKPSPAARPAATPGLTQQPKYDFNRLTPEERFAFNDLMAKKAGEGLSHKFQNEGSLPLMDQKKLDNLLMKARVQ